MQAAPRLYPGFPAPNGMSNGRYSPTQYTRTRHCMTNPPTSFFGGFDESIFQAARAEAALVAGIDMKSACTSSSTTMLKPVDVLSSYQGPGHPNNHPYMPGPDMTHLTIDHPIVSPSMAPAMTMEQHAAMAMHHQVQFPQYTHHPGLGPMNVTQLTPGTFGAAAMGTSPRYPPGMAAVSASVITGEPDTDPRELERFAEHFKQRRIKLGVTQADVGRALAHLKMPGVGSLSQSTICRFESLTLSHNNMVALKPILHSWLEKAEEASKSNTGDNPSSAGILPNSEKKRKRTSIAAPEKRSLEAYFALQPRPSGEKIAAIADKLDLKKNVVRVWFCNQRQKQKRCRNQTPNRMMPMKSSPGGYFGSD